VKKTRRTLGKKIVAIAFAVGLLGGGKALGQVYPGCDYCGVRGCRSVDDGQYGWDQCTVSWGMNLGNFGLVCTTGGEICYKASTSITVTGEDPGRCNLLDWIIFGCESYY
jgi:hypothetical protein